MEIQQSSSSKGEIQLFTSKAGTPEDHRAVEMLAYVTVFVCLIPFSDVHRLVGLVVKASASRAEGPGFESRLRRDFFGVESYQ